MRPALIGRLRYELTAAAEAPILSATSPVDASASSNPQFSGVFNRLSKV